MPHSERCTGMLSDLVADLCGRDLLACGRHRTRQSARLSFRELLQGAGVPRAHMRTGVVHQVRVAAALLRHACTAGCDVVSWYRDRVCQGEASSLSLYSSRGILWACKCSAGKFTNGQRQ